MNEQAPNLIPRHQDAATDALGGVVVPLLDSYAIASDRHYLIVRAIDVHGEANERSEEVRRVGFRPIEFHASDATAKVRQSGGL